MMKKASQTLTISYFLLLFIISTGLTCKPESKTFSNPIIPGFNPDPSICRVGDDFYLVTSSFEYFPGVPVYHSTDLVNWQMIGHALHRPEQLNLTGIPSTAGIYAPTIRYNNGTFYMITTLVTGSIHRPDLPKGNFIVTAKNPAGPWSNPHWINDAQGIDPSLFFDDDGRAYYCGNGTPKNQVDPHHKIIWSQEIDLETFQLKGSKGILDSKRFFEEDLIGSPLAFEGPHIYKKDGTYYLLVSHGGTGMGHAVSIWKSNSPLGPWEMNAANPILTNRGNSKSGINCTGHADIIQTKDGDWWTVFLGVRSADGKQNVMGRETFLAPVEWTGVWPIVNSNDTPGKISMTFPAPKLLHTKQRSFDFEDDFNSNTLKLDWTFIRTPQTKWFNLDKAPGFLEISLHPEQIQQYVHPSFLGVRVIGAKTEFNTSLSFKPQKQGEQAGLALLRGHQPNWSVVKELLDGELKVSTYYGDSLLNTRALNSNEDLQLRIQLIDFQIHFFAKEKENEWMDLGVADAHELGFPPAGRFTGSFCGLYATSKGDTSNTTASFDWYKMHELK